MKSTSALLASAFLMGTSNAQCNSTDNTCATGNYPFLSTCYLTNDPDNNTCVDCPVGQVNNYLAGAVPSDGFSPLNDTTACVQDGQCMQQFGDKMLPWPQWLGLLNGAPLPGYTPDDVPSFVQLLYGFYGDTYPTAPFAELQPTLPVNEAEEVYVELFPNGANGCNNITETKCVDSVFPVLNGLKFAVSSCTKLIFEENAVNLQFRSGEKDGELTCEFGLFLGHSCEWNLGLALEDPTQVVDVEGNATCVPFPAGQGFQLKVHCHGNYEDGSYGRLKNFRPANEAILDRALHDSTCRDVGRVEFPCSFPAFCEDVASDPLSKVLQNASYLCESDILSGNCTAVQSCLSSQPNVTDMDFYTECIEGRCDGDGDGDASSASIVAGSLVMAFLALF